MTKTAAKQGDVVPSSSSRPRRSFAAAAAAVLSVVALFAAPAFAAGGSEPNRATAHAAEAGGPSLAFEPFDQKTFTDAQKSGAPYVLYFEAEWCVPCEEMHARTFRSPAVLEAAAGIRFFRVDLTKPDHYAGLVKKSFQIIGTPTTIFFGTDSKESARRFGFIPPADFAKYLGASRKPSPSS